MTLFTRRRVPLVLVVTAVALVLAGCGTPASAPPAASGPGSGIPAPVAPEQAVVPQIPGLVVHRSSYDPAGTVARVQQRVSQAGMVVATVDHAAAAAGAGLQLRPTTVVLGGNPNAGTPVIAAAQTAGLDLPQKYLIWQDEDGSVYLGYNAAGYLAARAGLDPAAPALEQLRSGSATIAAEASGTPAPVADGSTAAAPGRYLVERTSDADVAASVARYDQAFTANDLSNPATVDHAANAARVGSALRPTVVTFAGNPQVGTPLMQQAQTMGIDLPLRYLTWADEAGTVHVGYPDIRSLAARHEVSGVEQQLAMAEKATAMLTARAAGAG